MEKKEKEEYWEIQKDKVTLTEREFPRFIADKGIGRSEDSFPNLRKQFGNQI